jgi:hypothetical protein
MRGISEVSYITPPVHNGLHEWIHLRCDIHSGVVYVHIMLRHGPEKSASEAGIGVWGQWPRFMCWQECHVSILTCWSNAVQEGAVYATSIGVPVTATDVAHAGLKFTCSIQYVTVKPEMQILTSGVSCLSWIPGGVRMSVQSGFSEHHCWVVSFISGCPGFRSQPRDQLFSLRFSWIPQVLCGKFQDIALPWQLPYPFQFSIH